MLPVAIDKTETSLNAHVHVRFLGCTDIISVCFIFKTSWLHLMFYHAKMIFLYFTFHRGSL